MAQPQGAVIVQRKVSRQGHKCTVRSWAPLSVQGRGLPALWHIRKVDEIAETIGDTRVSQIK